MKFDLARMREVMSAFNHPQNSFPSVHVAGTNGKGSVTAMVTNALHNAGLKVAMYTSPHLEKINERFQINGSMISDSDLARLSRQLYRKFPKLTQFEFLTALAFLWFGENNIDVAVVEVGLGGRLDATNVMERVLVSVITNIDFDHMNWLGKTLPKIAAEKAGIIKPGVPVVTGATGVSLSVISHAARLNNTPLTVVAKSSHALHIKLEGAHQRNNAAVAEAVLHVLMPRIEGLKEKNIEFGVRNAQWPGRFERFLLGSGPLKNKVILDGAHNVAGCRALVKTIKEKKLAPINLLFGALRDKEIQSMVKVLSEVVRRAVIVRVPSDRSAEPKQVASMKEWRGRATWAPSIGSGWKEIFSAADRPILIAGSLYLIGEVRRRIMSGGKGK